MRQYGLIGFPLTHSFSKKYFEQKFLREGITGCAYDLFAIEKIEQLPELLKTHPNLHGLNVTIPFKQQVMPYLHDVDGPAVEVGAVNCIKIIEGILIGYNTDVYGFEKSLVEFIGNDFNGNALVLGTGGSAKAVCYVLNKLGITYQLVSREKGEGHLTYGDITPDILEAHHLMINTTPLGMYPHVDSCAALPHHHLTPNHFVFDLVYNPAETLLLQKAKAQGAKTKNGLEMLELQAERSWEIWNS
jgi:shikimate dehydrogenase